MERKIKYKISTINYIIPFIWLFVAVIWLFNIMQFGLSFLKFLNVVLALAVAVLWYVRVLIMKSKEYIVINEGVIKIRKNFFYKPLSIQLESISSIENRKNHYCMFYGSNKVKIYKTYLNRDDKNYLTALLNVTGE